MNAAKSRNSQARAGGTDDTAAPSSSEHADGNASDSAERKGSAETDQYKYGTLDADGHIVLDGTPEKRVGRAPRCVVEYQNRGAPFPASPSLQRLVCERSVHCEHAQPQGAHATHKPTRSETGRHNGRKMSRSHA